MTIQKIIIADYDSQWPVVFEREKQVLLHALSAWPVVLEHIGSTAVPGLSAKPVIDIMIGVESLDVVDASFVAGLESLGYEYVPEYEEELPQRRYFRKNDQKGVRIHQIHVAQKDSVFWQQHLFFRNYLRNHPDAVREYDALKRELAACYSDTQEYARAKSRFIRAILSLWS